MYSGLWLSQMHLILLFATDKPDDSKKHLMYQVSDILNLVASVFLLGAVWWHRVFVRCHLMASGVAQVPASGIVCRPAI